MAYDKPLLRYIRPITRNVTRKKILTVLYTIGFGLLLILFFILFCNYKYNVRIRTIREYQKAYSLIRPSSNLEEPIDTWRYIGNKDLRHQIYSAYFDSRTELIANYQPPRNKVVFGSVRVFGVLTRVMPSKVYCHFKYESNKVQEIEPLESVALNEHEWKPHSAYTVLCPVTSITSKSSIHLPKYVALVYESDPMTFSTPTFVPIRYPKGDLVGEPTRGIAVCTGPMHKNYNQALRLVEYVEMYKMLGAEKFYFYNMSSTSNISQILEYYEERGVAETMDWKLEGYEWEVNMRYYGIFAALNECLYRATFVDGFKYVVIVDLDEILIPLKFNSLTEYMEENDNSDIGSWLFRVAFFHGFEKSDSFNTPEDAINKFLYTQAKVRRIEPLAPYDRSKYIVKARSIIEVGNHWVWRTLPNVKEVTLPVEDGLTYHYRDDCVINVTCNKRTVVVDYSARRFGSILWDKVDPICGIVFKSGVCPIS